jgi:uncharacterized protein with PIN domain
MDGNKHELKARLEQLLREAAEVSVAIDRADGTIQGVPHYSVIELRAHELGRQLSRRIQERHMGEIAAFQVPKAPCPKCGTRCEVVPKKRPVTSIDGPVQLQELEGRCPFCRKAFFPLRETLGLDARELTPTLVLKIVVSAAETRSFVAKS